MSLTTTMLASSPVAAADGGAGPSQTGVACAVAASAAPARNGQDVAAAAKFEPEIYCLKHGAQHAANGFAPCTDLGCSGCGRR